MKKQTKINSPSINWTRIFFIVAIGLQFVWLSGCTAGCGVTPT